MKENGKMGNIMDMVNSPGLMDLPTRGITSTEGSRGWELSTMPPKSIIAVIGKMVLRMVRGHCLVRKVRFSNKAFGSMDSSIESLNSDLLLI